MRSVNSPRRESIDQECTQLQTPYPVTHQILQSKPYLIVRATSTVPRLSHASSQANSRAYKPRRALQARTAFSVSSFEHESFLQNAGDTASIVSLQGMKSAALEQS